VRWRPTSLQEVSIRKSRYLSSVTTRERSVRIWPKRWKTAGRATVAGSRRQRCLALSADHCSAAESQLRVFADGGSLERLVMKSS